MFVSRLTFILTACLLLCSGRTFADEYKVESLGTDSKFDEFYSKIIRASGYPIVSSAKVNDYALKEAAYLADLMLANRPDVRQAMIQSGSYLVIMAHDEFTSDVPEHSHLKPHDYWDARARGLGGSKTDPVCSCGEENLLAYPGDPYAAECIFIHEFAHNIHLRGLVNVDPTFDDRLELAYKEAMRNHLWRGKYASVNHHEYWAEGVQSWFNNNRPPDHDHNHVDTREELRAYDKGLAALCEEVFGITELAYTKPTERLTGHLEGYDPSAAPTFSWPERLNSVRADIRAKAVARLDEKEEEPPEGRNQHSIQEVEGWKVFVDKRLLADPHKLLGDLALRVLSNKLHELTLLIPENRLRQLREVPIWLDLDHPLRSAQYHPDASWLIDNGYNPDMEKAVHLPNAQRLVDMARRNRQPFVMLHELAHALHDRVLDFDHPDIKRAYDHIVDSRRYESVLLIDGKYTRHYALTNHKEFFAEMSEAFFGTNDFYPFVRAELQEFEPEVFQLLTTIWKNVPEETPEQGDP